MEPLDFSTLTIQEVPVTGPDGKHYVLREANGRTATEHRDAVISASQFGPDGKVTGIKGLAAVEARFVSSCLWDENNRNPSVQLIQSWPARVQKTLYEKAKELSEFTDEAPLREALELALKRDDSPIVYEEFCKWVNTLKEDEFKPLVRLFGKPISKNS